MARWEAGALKEALALLGIGVAAFAVAVLLRRLDRRLFPPDEELEKLDAEMQQW